MKFTPRLTKPEKGNKYYNTINNGGISPCIKGKPTDKDCDVLANCVGYEVGRFNEESGEEKILFFGSMNAKNFYSYAIKWKIPTGDTPKVGACICFDGGKSGKGHVANIEAVDENGNCTISSSGYNSYAFKIQKNCNKKNNYGMNSSYKLQGFVYNPHLEETTNEKAIKILSEATILIDEAIKLIDGEK